MRASNQPPAAPGAPSGMPADEKKVAAGMTIGALLLGSMMGGVIFALAVGIEQAFAKSGWERPGWTGSGPAMTPEELQERREQAVAAAQEHLRQARERRAERTAARRRHQEDITDWLAGGKDGAKPERPEGMVRNPWAFLKDAAGMSRTWYTLFDDKMAKGNEKVTGTYPKIAEFLRGVWNFGTGFAEGFGEGWRQHRERNNSQPAADQKAPAAEPPQTSVDQDPVRVDAVLGPEPEPESRPQPEESRPATPLPGPPPPAPAATATGPAGPAQGTLEGEVMDNDGQPVAIGGAPAAAAPQGPGETNLDLMFQAFRPIAPLLASVDTQMPPLINLAQTIRARVDEIAALCQVHTMPIQVTQLVVQARDLTTVINNGLGYVQVNNEGAREAAEEALIGLQPAAVDQDATHAQGARGDIYNRAGSRGVRS